MANTLKLEIVTPDSKTYSEDVEMVTLPGVEGEMGVYPMHVPLMTQIVAGEVIARKNGQDYFLAIGGGFVGARLFLTQKIEETHDLRARKRKRAPRYTATRAGFQRLYRWPSPWFVGGDPAPPAQPGS